MPSTEEESIPSEKMREMENGKVVVQAKNNIEKKEETIPIKKPKFPTYFIVSELILLAISIVSFTFCLVEPSLFFNILTTYYGTYVVTSYTLRPYVFIIALPAIAIALLNNYLYLFKLDPHNRLRIFAIRLLTVVSFATLPIPLWTPDEYYYENHGMLILLTILMLYALLDHFTLRVFLLTNDKSIGYTLFKKTVAGSPSELEWRKYQTASGYLAIFTGIIGIQFFWLIYHSIIRPTIVKNAKRRLIVNSLNFEEEVNLSTVALDLGISLEETIFILKQLQLKRHITLEFTRYGAKLHEIRKARLFSIVLQEKYDLYLSKQKMSDYELKANHFIELTERTRIRVEDFKRLMSFNEEFSIDDFVLYLPPKVAFLRKPLFANYHVIVMNHDQALIRREKIVKLFVENGDKMFAEMKTTPKTKSSTS